MSDVKSESRREAAPVRERATRVRSPLGGEKCFAGKGKNKSVLRLESGRTFARMKRLELVIRTAVPPLPQGEGGANLRYASSGGEGGEQFSRNKTNNSVAHPIVMADPRDRAYGAPRARSFVPGIH